MCTRGGIQIKMASLMERIQTASAVLSLPVADAARLAGPDLDCRVAGLRLHGIPPVERHQRVRLVGHRSFRRPHMGRPHTGSGGPERGLRRGLGRGILGRGILRRGVIVSMDRGGGDCLGIDHEFCASRRGILAAIDRHIQRARGKAGGGPKRLGRQHSPREGKIKVLVGAILLRGRDAAPSQNHHAKGGKANAIQDHQGLPQPIPARPDYLGNEAVNSSGLGQQGCCGKPFPAAFPLTQSIVPSTGGFLYRVRRRAKTGFVVLAERIAMPAASFLTRLLPVLFAVISLAMSAPKANADDKVLRMGTLKLIHGITPYFYEKFAPPGYKIEVVPFESPTDGKNAVLTGTVDTCIHGIAAFLLGAAAGEPVVIVAAATNRGMGIVADAKSDIKTIKDLKGKRVAITPGSTQEVVILERLKAEGMTVADIQPIRLSFSDMAGALARGDIDAYVGAEPGPGISLANGTGRLIEYPYSTPIGSLNMILSASEKMIKENPERLKMIVKMHEQATDYAMAHPDEMIEVAMQKLGQQRKSIEIAIPNVELTWKIDDQFIKRAKAYSELMVEKKQVRQAPDMSRAITDKFM